MRAPLCTRAERWGVGRGELCPGQGWPLSVPSGALLCRGWGGAPGVQPSLSLSSSSPVLGELWLFPGRQAPRSAWLVPTGCPQRQLPELQVTESALPPPRDFRGASALSTHQAVSASHSQP